MALGIQTSHSHLLSPPLPCFFAKFPSACLLPSHWFFSSVGGESTGTLMQFPSLSFLHMLCWQAARSYLESVLCLRTCFFLFSCLPLSFYLSSRGWFLSFLLRSSFTPFSLSSSFLAVYGRPPFSQRLTISSTTPAYPRSQSRLLSALTCEVACAHISEHK